MLRVGAEDQISVKLGSSLDEILAEDVWRTLTAAVEVEVDTYVGGLADEIDGDSACSSRRPRRAPPRRHRRRPGRADRATGERPSRRPRQTDGASSGGGSMTRPKDGRTYCEISGGCDLTADCGGP